MACSSKDRSKMPLEVFPTESLRRAPPPSPVEGAWCSGSQTKKGGVPSMDHSSSDCVLRRSLSVLENAVDGCKPFRDQGGDFVRTPTTTRERRLPPSKASSLTPFQRYYTTGNSGKPSWLARTDGEADGELTTGTENLTTLTPKPSKNIDVALEKIYNEAPDISWPFRMDGPS